MVCPCKPKTDEEVAEVSEWSYAYRVAVEDLVASRRYDTNEDFTVISQPMLTETTPPLKVNVLPCDKLKVHNTIIILYFILNNIKHLHVKNMTQIYESNEGSPSCEQISKIQYVVLQLCMHAVSCRETICTLSRSAILRVLWIVMLYFTL